MTGEEALRDLRRLLAAYTRDDDLDPLIREAMAGAREDVAHVLRRLARDAMLERVAERLGASLTPDPTAPSTAGDAEAAAPRRSVAADDEAYERPAVYLHGIVRSHHPLEEDVAGILDGSYVRLVPVGDLAAAVSDARVSDLEPGDDPAELEARLRAHDATLRVLLAAGPVLPVGFGVVLRDDARVRQLVDRNAGALLAALDRVAGASEWGLTVRRKEGAAAADAGASTGRQWLARHRGRDVDDLLKMVHERLAEVATDGEPPAAKEDADASHVAAASYLVGEDDREEFLAEYEALVEQLDAAGLILDLSGPWPPYSFVPPLEDAP